MPSKSRKLKHFLFPGLQPADLQLKLHCRLSLVSSLLIYPADPGTGQPPQSHEPITQATFSFYVYDVYVHMYTIPHCFSLSGEPYNPIHQYTLLFSHEPALSFGCYKMTKLCFLPLLSVSQPSSWSNEQKVGQRGGGPNKAPQRSHRP